MALAGVEQVAEPLAAVEQVAAPLAAVEQVLVREQELVPGQERELAAEMAPPAEALILSNIFTPVHTDGLTRTGSARECFRFKGAIRAGLFKGAIRVGLVAAA